MLAKKSTLQPADPTYLRNTLQKACQNNGLKSTYAKFTTASVLKSEIVSVDQEIPMVGALNLVTFALPGCFHDLYFFFLAIQITVV
jgi:hypothetical protein